MIRLVTLLAFVLLFISCREKSPCAVGAGESYTFPELPKTSSGRTTEEVNQFYDLPEDVSKCMSTASLVETCLAYPQWGLMHTAADPQTGYPMIRSIFRGLRELEIRPDRGEYLLRKYKMVDLAGYDPNGTSISIGRHVQQISYLELILSQEKMLESLSLSQKIELIERARVVYKQKNDYSSVYGLSGLATTSAILAQLMRIGQYQPFLNDNNPNVQKFVQYFWHTDYATVQTVYALSTDYLNLLKQK